MTVNCLVVTIEATHQSLKQRLDDANDYAALSAKTREQYARTDAFLAGTCRHLAAVDEVVLPVVRHRLPDGTERAR
jgi:uncharacterized protein YqiB (DUF1249 family)